MTSRSSTRPAGCWRKRLPEGWEGVIRLHALIAEQMPDDWADLEPGVAAALVKVGIETDRGPWVGAPAAAGYEVFAINPHSVARYRERHSTSGAKSDAADAHLLAEIVRLDRAHHRPREPIVPFQLLLDSMTGWTPGANDARATADPATSDDWMASVKAAQASTELRRSSPSSARVRLTVRICRESAVLALACPCKPSRVTATHSPHTECPDPRDCYCGSRDTGNGLVTMPR